MKVLKAPHLKGRHVEMKNSFTVLEGVTEEEVDVVREDQERKEVADIDILPQGRVLVLGDSQVKYLVCFAPEIGNVGPGCVYLGWGLGR